MAINQQEYDLRDSQRRLIKEGFENVVTALSTVAAAAGITWEGAWTTSTDYLVNQLVSNDDDVYVCTVAHTAGDADDEPGTGAVWADYWDLFVASGGGGGGGATNLTWTASTSTVASDTGTDAVLTAVDATNPGLMTVAQKTKLDGIETAATADQSAAEILAALLTVDGAASGLDADLLDGSHASAFEAAGTAASAVSAHEADTTAVHGIADTSALLDTADIGVSVQAHSAVLDATTASFTTSDETKLDGIEALADVTDAANVAAAGAHMAGGTDVPITDGGTGASDAATARTNLGVDAAGTDNSTDVTLAGTPDYITIAGQVITRGLIDLTTDVTGDLPVADGGTGSSTASGARTNLGLVIGTDVQAHSAVLDATTASFTTADETKLDGIETAATADQTAADIRGLGFFDTSNDGAASGLDADLLDGNHAAAFATASHTHATSDVTSGTFADARISESSVTQHSTPHLCKLRDVTGIAINGSTTNLFTWNSQVIVDSPFTHSTSTNSSRITLTTSYDVYVSAVVSFTSSGAYTGSCYVRVNGTTGLDGQGYAYNSAAATNTMQLNMILVNGTDFTSGDYIEIIIRRKTGTGSVSAERQESMLTLMEMR